MTCRDPSRPPRRREPGRATSSRTRASSCGASARRPSRYSVDVTTELYDETNSGTATISVTPRAASASTAVWMLARVAMPNATSTGWSLSTRAASARTLSFHCGLPPCARSRMPCRVCPKALTSTRPAAGHQQQRRTRDQRTDESGDCLHALLLLLLVERPTDAKPDGATDVGPVDRGRRTCRQ